MAAGDAARQRKPDAVAPGSLAALEAIEELRNRGQRDTGAMVNHRHPTTRSLDRERDLDPIASGTVVDGIGEEVDDHLLEEIGIAPDHRAARRRHDPDATFFRASLDALERRRHDRLEVDRPQARGIERRGPRITEDAFTHLLDPSRQAIDSTQGLGEVARGLGAASLGITLEEDGMDGIDELVGDVGVEA